MVLAKRGLGRGLEALLVKVPIMARASQQISTIEQAQVSQNQELVSVDLQNSLHPIETDPLKNHLLLQEAEALKSFLDDFETMLQQHSL